MKKILITGGAGYIGSHCYVLLKELGFETLIFDSFIGANKEYLKDLEEITNEKVDYYEGDLNKYEDINKALKEFKPDVIMHFAAFKNVGESTKEVKKYHTNNVIAFYNLLDSMVENNINNIIFSSSCSVQGNPDILPVTEEHKLDALSPYAHTKLINETILKSYKFKGINSVILRYFNAAGAHTSGLIGEDPTYLLNLIPRIFLSEGVYGEWPLKIYGHGYDTIDGFKVRDYIHVEDIANAHAKAINYLEKNEGVEIFNVATGQGSSIMQIIKEIEEVTGKKVKYEIVDGPKGDTIEVYASTKKAKELLKFEAKYTLKDIIESCNKWYLNYLKNDIKNK